MTREIAIELLLLWKLSLVDLFGPEGVFAKMLPVDTLHRVFLKETRQQIIESRRETFNLRGFLLANLLNEVFQASRIEGWLSGRELVEDAS